MSHSQDTGVHVRKSLGTTLCILVSSATGEEKTFKLTTVKGFFAGNEKQKASAQVCRSLPTRSPYGQVLETTGCCCDSECVV